jgi:hypothetical protein
MSYWVNNKTEAAKYLIPDGSKILFSGDRPTGFQQFMREYVANKHKKKFVFKNRETDETEFSAYLLLFI